MRIAPTAGKRKKSQGNAQGRLRWRTAAYSVWRVLTVVSAVAALACIGFAIAFWVAALLIWYSPFRKWLEAKRGYRMSFGRLPGVEKGSNGYVAFVVTLGLLCFSAVSWWAVFKSVGLAVTLLGYNDFLLILFKFAPLPMAVGGIVALYNWLVFGWSLPRFHKIKVERATTEIPEDDYEFELFVANLFRRINFQAEVVGARALQSARREVAAAPPEPQRPGDGGVDILLQPETILLRTNSEISAVQCKRYAPHRNVGVKEVRELCGVLTNKKIRRGFFVTTGGFTVEALRFNCLGQIVFVDGKRLATWINSEKEMCKATGYSPIKPIVELYYMSKNLLQNHPILVVFLLAALAIPLLAYLNGITSFSPR